MFESMTEARLEEFASTKRKGKPEHVDKRSRPAKRQKADAGGSAAC